MPYSIVKGGGTCKSSEWAVVKDSDGKTMGCHATKGEAEDQVAAIHANEGKKMNHLAKVRLVLPEEREVLLQELQRRDVAPADDGDLFFWDAEVSNDLLDTYYTHMSAKTLANYAEDAERGVAFLKGHDWHSLPIGYSLSGKLETDGDRQRVVAGFYTSRSLPEAADLIKRMETRLLRDVSVGFHGERMVCDICGSDFWECRHFPGLTYEEKKGDLVSQTLATFTIDDARLSEVSGVFDGATPNAMILKAERAARAGELSPDQVQLLEHGYRVHLPVSRSFTVPEIPKEPKAMTEEELVQVRTMLGAVLDSDIPGAIDSLQQDLDDARSRVRELEPQAADGAQYRADLVESALAEGVRAQGNGFNRSLYEETLRNAPLAVIKQMRDDWKRIADTLLPTGRRSQDQEAPASQVPSLIDDSAFRV